MQGLIKKLLSVAKNRFSKIYRSLQTFAVEAITEKGWLLDWIPSTRADAESVMLVRLDVIGDFILWLDSAKAYRSLYPGKKIVLYANSTWAALASQMNHWDEVVSIDMTRLRSEELYRLNTFYKIRRRGFPLVIQPTYSRELMGDMLMRSSVAARRIGFECDLSNILPMHKVISDAWYTNLIKTDSAQMMELKRNAEFVRALGMTGFICDTPQIDIKVKLNINLLNAGQYVVIFPGASWVPKMWPASQFAELIRILKNRYGVQSILCGGSSEFELCQQVIRLSGLVNVKNFAGKTNLTELIEVIRRAQFLFANDTSAIHIASATHTPSVCILGGGHYGRFLPYEIETRTYRILPKIVFHKMDCYNCNWNCKYTKTSNQTVPCIEQVELSQVVAYYEQNK